MDIIWLYVASVYDSTSRSSDGVEEVGHVKEEDDFERLHVVSTETLAGLGSTNETIGTLHALYVYMSVLLMYVHICMLVT